MKHRSTVLRVLAVCAILPFLASCGLIFGGTRQVIRTTSSPDGVTIATNPLTVNYKTPTSINLERRHNYTLAFSADGYQPQTVELQRSIRGGIVVLDILLGVVPVIVDAVTGAWWKLSPDVVNVSLTKLAGTSGLDRIDLAIDLRDGADGTEILMQSNAPGVSVSVQPH